MVATALDERKAMQTLAVEWTRAQSTITAFIASVVRDHHDAEDILQRTAAAVVAKFDHYDATRPFTAWAIGIAKVELLRFRQERGKERVVFDDEAIRAIATAYGESESQLRDLKEAIVDCLSQLRGRVRGILEAYVRKGADTEGIAADLNMTKNAVFVTLHRARTALRQCIDRRMARTGGHQ